MNHLLLMACSATKRPSEGLLPAIERYDGPAYKVLRGWLARGGTLGEDGLSVLILSGGYGLISGDVPIPVYDQRMTPRFAALLRPAVAHRLAQLRPAGEVLVMLGQSYRAAIPDALPWPAARTSGGIGVQLGQLKAWLDALPLPAARAVGEGVAV